jgi:hypothetical protein
MPDPRPAHRAVVHAFTCPSKPSPLPPSPFKPQAITPNTDATRHPDQPTGAALRVARRGSNTPRRHIPSPQRKMSSLNAALSSSPPLPRPQEARRLLSRDKGSAASSPGLPVSTIRPPPITTSQSASMTVCRRWAMVRTVAEAHTSRISCCSRASVRASNPRHAAAPPPPSPPAAAALARARVLAAAVGRGALRSERLRAWREQRGGYGYGSW